MHIIIIIIAILCPQLASFPYQDLQHQYQTSNTGRILDRLKHVAYINLRDNSLLDLSSYSFPK